MRVRPGPFIGPLVLSESCGGLNQHQVVPEGTEFDTCPLSSTETKFPTPSGVGFLCFSLS